MTPIKPLRKKPSRKGPIRDKNYDIRYEKRRCSYHFRSKIMWKNCHFLVPRGHFARTSAIWVHHRLSFNCRPFWDIGHLFTIRDMYIAVSMISATFRRSPVVFERLSVAFDPTRDLNDSTTYMFNYAKNVPIIVTKWLIKY